MSRPARQPNSSGPPPFWGRLLSKERAFAWAPAKVNLFLELHGRRDDGYHELETLMLAVDLFDLLEIVVLREEAIGVSCANPAVPNNLDNLIVKAGLLFLSQFGPGRGAMVRLSKKIPMEAGLGGGSSDAASTLLAMNELLGVRAPLEKLRKLAGRVGSDVAFFLSPPAGWCTGRGEQVLTERPGSEFDLVIVKPPVACATAAVYAQARVPAKPIDGTAVRTALRQGDVEMLGRLMHNRLEEAALKVAPEIAAVLDCLRAAGPAGAIVSGSGSACVALCRNRREAIRVADVVREAGPAGTAPDQVFVVKSWPAV